MASLYPAKARAKKRGVTTRPTQAVIACLMPNRRVIILTLFLAKNNPLKCYKRQAPFDEALFYWQNVKNELKF
jgi:hypothetical protein